MLPTRTLYLILYLILSTTFSPNPMSPLSPFLSPLVTASLFSTSVSLPLCCCSHYFVVFFSIVSVFLCFGFLAKRHVGS